MFGLGLMQLFVACAAVAGTATSSERIDRLVPPEFDFRIVSAIPVQSNGRVAPFDTVARRMLSIVCGRQTWERRDAVAVVWSWALAPSEWLDEPIIKVEHEPLKQASGLAMARRHFSYRELAACQSLQQLIATADDARRSQRKLSGLERQADEIADRMGTFEHVLRGRALTIVPQPGHADAAWMPCSKSLAGPAAGAGDAWEAMESAFGNRDSAAFLAASRDLSASLAVLGQGMYPAPKTISRELLYNRVHPFRWAWVLMGLTVVVGLIGAFLGRRGFDVLTMTCMAVGFGFFVYGFSLRWVISGRAPLSNMYESLTVFAGSISLFALIFFVFHRQRFLPVVAAALSAAGFVLADVLPLDSSITTLPPVLRNTIWLTIHVMTIMMGYGAAGLAMGVAHVQLGLMTLSPKRTAQARETTRLAYWVILVAVIFLTAGIIFGSIWANSSWGRYWGWDPKETWSLITLFGYLGLLHARHTGWLRDFGMAVANIACFQLVIMTYYGVNYVLGTGLHSYGFGAGGIGWVLAYLVIEAIAVGAAAWRYRQLLQNGQVAPGRGPMATAALAP